MEAPNGEVQGTVIDASKRKKDFITDTTFESLDIDIMTKKALKEHMKYELMTAV